MSWFELEFRLTVFSFQANIGLKTIFLKSKKYYSTPGYWRGQEKRTWNEQHLSQDQECCSVLLPAGGRTTDWFFSTKFLRLSDTIGMLPLLM